MGAADEFEADPVVPVLASWPYVGTPTIAAPGAGIEVVDGGGNGTGMSGGKAAESAINCANADGAGVEAVLGWIS